SIIPFSFTAPAYTGLYTLSLHDALPISHRRESERPAAAHAGERRRDPGGARRGVAAVRGGARAGRRGRARAPRAAGPAGAAAGRSEEHTSELQSRGHLVCRLLLEKKNHN